MPLEKIDVGNVVAPPKICVVICTFNRPALLTKLLIALEPQVLQRSCHTIILDSGAISAAGSVEPFLRHTNIHYYQAKVSGLSAARNQSLKLALALEADFIAFIDDDEWPSSCWLAGMMSVAESSGADVVAGPVHPLYENAAPWWVLEQGFFAKPADVLSTANLFLRSSRLPKNEDDWFHHSFGFSGGEDEEFLSRLVKAGRSCAIAPNAIVYEHVPIIRMTARYLWWRGFRDGAIAAKLIRHQNNSVIAILYKLARVTTAKFFYGLNHIIWSPIAPSRFYCGLADFSAVLGIVSTLLGLKFAFYGQNNYSEN